MSGKAPSFQARVAGLLIALVAVIQFPAFIAVYAAIRNNVAEQAHQQLNIGARVFAQLLDARGAQLLETVKILTSDFAFKQAVATGDTETIRSVLFNHGGRIGASEVLLVSLNGQITASTLQFAGRTPLFPFPELLQKAEQERYATATVLFQGQPHQMVVVPVYAPLRVAWVGMGFEMNDALLAEMQDLTGLQLSLLGYDATAGETPLLASTLAPEARAELADDVRRHGGSEKVFTLALDSGDFLTLPVTLGSGQDYQVTAILQTSLAKAFGAYSGLRNQLALISGASFLLSLLGSLWLARKVTQPLRELAGAARRIGSGDYQTPVSVKRRDEIGDFAQAFNAMQQGIAEREEKIAHQAYHDSLTGLPNRALAHDRLQTAIARAKRNHTPIGVLMADVDRFKEINDTLGHHIGDQVLVELGKRLVGALRASDTVARLGGDEFLLLVEGANLGSALGVGEELLVRMNKPVHLDAMEIYLDLSIGVVVYPDHGDDADALLRRADIAMYDAKASGKSPTGYEPGRDARHLHRLALINDLRRAIENNELRVHYQPKVDLQTCSITHVEALLRWQHPQQGLLMPDEFIPLAEHSGRIRMLTGWVLDAVLTQAAGWTDTLGAVGVAVNISAIDLASNDLPDVISRYLKKHKVPPERLILEVTESAVMRDATTAIETLQRLRNLGVRLSIDDFGTGYSSLSHLKRLPVDELKIDQSFVLNLAQDTDDAVIVKSTIELGHNMGLKVVAEGVETEQAARLLDAYHCDMLQGYLISKPLPPEKLAEWFAQFKADNPCGKFKT